MPFSEPIPGAFDLLYGFPNKGVLVMTDGALVSYHSLDPIVCTEVL